MKPLISGFILAISGATSAFAEPVCMQAPEMSAALTDWYGEVPTAAPNALKEQVLANANTGTWTLIRLEATGRACVIAQGEDWMGAFTQDEMLASIESD
ncbi:MAG: S-adenosyl-L-homocysteine hydrolase [Pseudomonadota bacterium]